MTDTSNVGADASRGHTPGQVSVMPRHNGDGYSWGGDVVVSFGEQAINLGASRHSNCETVKLARLIAAAPELLEALEDLCSFETERTQKKWGNARVAIAKAKGEMK